MKEVTNQDTIATQKSAVAADKLSSPAQTTLLFPPVRQQENIPPPFCPLPKLTWANPRDLWQKMRQKDRCTPHPDHTLRSRHPTLTSHMRAVLLEWMMEVCEVYKLQRETYYLSVDMYERFMADHVNIRKEYLQKIGVTCLFAAAKFEEIYPPKATEFAYVTDGACSLEEMLSLEISLYKSLKWRLTDTVTVNCWVNTFLQLDSATIHPVEKREFHLPAFSPHEFIAVMQLLDLCNLDIGSRQFSSSYLAASALYHTLDRSRSNLLAITGLTLSELSRCINWMLPFVNVLFKHGIRPLKQFSHVSHSDTHNIQTHDLNLSMLKEVSEFKSLPTIKPQISMDSTVFLTPPHSQEMC